MKRLIQMFDHAFNAGRQYPKITLRWKFGSDEQIVQLSRTGPKANCGVGHINVTDGKRFGENRYFGRIDRDGDFRPSRDALAPHVQRMVQTFADDPIAFAKAYGDQIRQCCFCGLTLTNQDSIARGYGPICAANYGLEKGGLTLEREYEVEAPDYDPETKQEHRPTSRCECGSVLVQHVRFEQDGNLEVVRCCDCQEYRGIVTAKCIEETERMEAAGLFDSVDDDDDDDDDEGGIGLADAVARFRRTEQDDPEKKFHERANALANELRSCIPDDTPHEIEVRAAVMLLDWLTDV